MKTEPEHTISPTWTKENDDRLRELWNLNGLSAQKIAELIGGGISRNAVIGRARRMKLGAHRFASPRLPPLTEEQRAERRRALDAASARRRTAKRREAGKMEPQRPYRTEAPPVPLEPAQVYTDSLNLPLVELDPKGCLFATTGHDVLEHRFCGQRKLFGLPYCGFHCAAAFNPNPYRTKARAWRCAGPTTSCIRSRR